MPIPCLLRVKYLLLRYGYHVANMRLLIDAAMRMTPMCTRRRRFLARVAGPLSKSALSRTYLTEKHGLR